MKRALPMLCLLPMLLILASDARGQGVVDRLAAEDEMQELTSITSSITVPSRGQDSLENAMRERLGEAAVLASLLESRHVAGASKNETRKLFVRLKTTQSEIHELSLRGVGVDTTGLDKLDGALERLNRYYTTSDNPRQQP